MSLARGSQTAQVGSSLFPDNEGADEGAPGHQQAEEEDEEWFLRPSFYDTYGSNNHNDTPSGYYNPGKRRQYASQHFYRRVGTPSSSSPNSSSPTSAYGCCRGSQKYRSLGSASPASSRVRAHVENPISPSFESPAISPANGGGCLDALPSPTAATIGTISYGSGGAFTFFRHLFGIATGPMLYATGCSSSLSSYPISTVFTTPRRDSTAARCSCGSAYVPSSCPSEYGPDRPCTCR